jgi:hypothetical protein
VDAKTSQIYRVYDQKGVETVDCSRKSGAGHVTASRLGVEKLLVIIEMLLSANETSLRNHWKKYGC